MSRFVAFGAETRACKRDGIMRRMGWEEDGEVSPRALFRDKLDEQKHCGAADLLCDVFAQILVFQ